MFSLTGKLVYTTLNLPNQKFCYKFLFLKICNSTNLYCYHNNNSKECIYTKFQGSKLATGYVITLFKYNETSLILVLLLIAFRSNAQRYVLPDGEYIDTTVSNDTACKDYMMYYYQVGGKYLESSITVLKKVQTSLQHSNKIYKGSVYNTFRFRIDCAGHRTTRTQVLQTDENYKTYHFNEAFVNELYLFLNTLNN